jgi:hypothetical protein
VKYNINKQIIKAVHPFKIIFSPDWGGNQKFVKIKIIITKIVTIIISRSVSLTFYYQTPV